MARMPYSSSRGREFEKKKKNHTCQIPHHRPLLILLVFLEGKGRGGGGGGGGERGVINMMGTGSGG